MPASPRGGESGFTVVETMVALGVIFTVVVGLLGTMNAGVRGVIIARQRNGATAIADEVLEQARGRAYAEVGHDLDDDTTLATDTAITGVSPNFLYGGEPLAASAINSATNAPFAPHKWTSTRDNTPYTVYVYVTQIIPTTGNGDPYKRVTIKVSWGNAQYSTSSVPNSITQSTYLFNAAKPPNPWLDGLVDSDSGAFTVSGYIANADLNDAHIWLPYAHADVHSRDIQQAKGYAGSTRSQIQINSGTVTGCALTNGNLTADCTGQKAVSLADNDNGTTPPDYDNQSVTDGGHTVAAGSALSAVFGGTNSGLSQSAARSQQASSCGGVLGNDLLPFQCSTATGPSSLSFAFTAGPVSGSLLNGSAAATSTATVDRLDAPSVSRLSSVATTSVPALDVLTMSGAPAGYNGAVRVAAASATATANSGNGALAPTVTGANFTVQIYDTTGTPGYKSVTITPGVTSSNTGTAVFTIGGATVTMATTVTSTAKVLSSTSDSTGAITHSEASIANWLDVTVHLTIITGATTHADLTVDLDYGRVSSESDFLLN